MQIVLQQEIISLLPEKAVWLPQHRMLLVADLHLGKITHFRKAGLYMPAVNDRADLEIIQQLINRYAPDRLVFLGDLFHSQLNSGWQQLLRFLLDHPQLQVILTKGNHDILSDDLFRQARITVVDELAAGNLLLTHQPMNNLPKHIINIAGHIHPGYLHQAPGRQHYRLPCFYYYRQMLLLPAFGNYTGMHLLKKEPDSQIFVIAGQKIYPV